VPDAFVTFVVQSPVPQAIEDDADDGVKQRLKAVRKQGFEAKRVGKIEIGIPWVDLVWPQPRTASSVPRVVWYAEVRQFFTYKRKPKKDAEA
jgi:hypothetical protein